VWGQGAHREECKDDKSHGAKSRDSCNDSQYNHLINTLSDVKADMTKMLRIIHALDKQTNYTKTKTDCLKHDVDQLKKDMGKGGCGDHDVKSCDSDSSSTSSKSSSDTDSCSKSNDTSSCDSRSNDSSCSTLSVKSAESSKSSNSSCSSNSTSYSLGTVQTGESCITLDSCMTKDTSCTTQTSCSYDEFHKFKTEVIHMLSDLAKQVNDQMGMLANIMSTIAFTRKPIVRNN